MHKKLLVFLLAAACSATTPPTEHANAPAPQPSGEPSAELNTLVDGNSRFAIKLYRKLAAEKDGNIAFSPMSISTALAMAEAGAQGETDAQMRTVLELPAEGQEAHSAFRELLSTLKPGQDSKYKLHIANRLWSAHDLELHDAYVELTDSKYGAPIERIDFAESKKATKAINTWVEEQTEDRIKDLIPPNVIDSDTRLVLTNAIYFKGDWKTQFKESKTKKEDFFTASGDTVKTKMMHLTARFRLAEADGMQMLEMPYKGDELSMLVILPNAKDGLPALEASLDAKSMAVWTDALRPYKVEVSLPRFKAESSFELNTTLTEMGMPLAFTEGAANFKGIHVNPKEGLWISNVIHKAFVEVNEEGSEAAAATAVIVKKTRSARPKPQKKVFKADHPFIYIIRDNRTQSMLFMGRVAKF